jgi:hypothetical protein
MFTEAWKGGKDIELEGGKWKRKKERKKEKG